MDCCKIDKSSSKILMEYNQSQVLIKKLPKLKIQQINLLTKLINKNNLKIKINFWQIAEIQAYYFIKQKFYFLGDWKNSRFFGHCFFYFQNRQINRLNPIILLSYIDQNFILSPTSVMIFEDLSYYCGQFICKESQVPVANGQGTFVNKKIMYQGQFKEGKFHGQGYFHAPGLRILGNFNNGRAEGNILQKTTDGLFIGVLLDGKRKGRLLDRNNQQKQLNQIK